MQSSDYAEELQGKLKLSLALLKVMEPGKFVSVGEVTVEGRILAVDGVLQTTDTRCSPEHVGAAKCCNRGSLAGDAARNWNERRSAF